jgi:hypothetical protein
MGAVRGVRGPLLLDLWVLVLAVLLLLPALTQAGFGLSGDLVFSPQQPLTLDSVGLGARLPRAVPLDAFVGVLGLAVPGEVLYRVAVLAGPVLAGCGAHRLAGGCSLPARVAAATFAVWNPFVVERMALGQWALLLAYGSLFFVVAAAVRAVEPGERGPGALWPVWAWVGLASLTPTGGVLATVTAVTLAWRRSARTATIAAGCLVLQLPWLLPSIAGVRFGGDVGDPTGVLAFRAHADAPGGTLVSLVGLGGIWDLDSVPTSRTSALGVLAALVTVAVLLGGVRRLPPGLGRLVPLAGGGLLLALAPRVPGLEQLTSAVVEHVPGGGLLRDSQKWIAPLVVLTSLCLAVSLDRVRAWVGRRAAGGAAIVALLGVCLPLVLLPDATARTWDAVRPVTYPADFAEVRDRLQQAPDRGTMVLLPWRAYRKFDWGNPRSVHDPAHAWFDVAMVGSDDLVVGRRSVGDDEPGGQAVRRAAAGPDPAADLAALGVGWALVYTDDPGTPDLRLDGLDPVAGGSDVRLYRVPGVQDADSAVPATRRTLVVVVDLLVLAAWLAACGLAARQRFAARLVRVVRRDAQK